MDHIFQKGKNDSKPVIFMLHGTRGTEKDLIPLVKKLDPEASVLSVRGSVVETKDYSFVKIVDGLIDEEDLSYRTEKLYQFIHEAAEKYQFNRENIVALGLTNGATIATSLLFHYSDALKGAILYHPNIPRRDIQLPNLTGAEVFIGASRNNDFCPQRETIELESMFQKANANVTLHWENSKHYLSGEIFAASRAWYEEKFNNV